MEISAQHLGKRYNRQWIFRGFTYQFDAGKSYALTGPNGSGKSTLLQVLAGSTDKSEGQLAWLIDNKPVEPDHAFASMAMAAPYLELIEELTLVEFLQFHFSFKKMLHGWTTERIAAYVGLGGAMHKQIRHFSSGMKQRAKLAQAFFSDVPVLLLDEPTANLDVQGAALYWQMITELAVNRLLLIASNDEDEISFCHHRISILDYKPA
jgi:ABC-type multidrug transport system ATPase subunit